jgi:hypothetical protein
MQFRRGPREKEAPAVLRESNKTLSLGSVFFCGDLLTESDQDSESRHFEASPKPILSGRAFVRELSRSLLKLSGGSVDDYATFSASDTTSPSC